jgi:phage terminase large subunit
MTNKLNITEVQRKFLFEQEQHKIIFLGGRGGYKAYLRAVRLMHQILEELRKRKTNND